MSIRYEWSVNRLQCLREHEGNEKVVTIVFWVAIGYLFENTIVSSGSTAITYKSDHDFVPYDQLTQEEVISWIPQNMKDIVEAQILERLESVTIHDIEPDSISLPLPW